MHNRARMGKKEQIGFFNTLKQISKQSWVQLAAPFGLHERTLREWARGTYTPSHNILQELSKKYEIPLPAGLQVLPPHWHIPLHAKKAAMARLALYGPPGNKDTRRKGGIISQRRRQENPGAYPFSKWVLRKAPHKLAHSIALAELCGILLGDGGITPNQVKVTLHRTDDAEYAKKVKELMHTVFHMLPTEYERKNVRILCISSIGLVGELKQIGLNPGNKVKMQVRVPQWIEENIEYRRACVRGLIDTDGSIYSHKHSVNGHTYTHKALTFTNHSKPLIEAVLKALISDGLRAKKSGPYKIYVYNEPDIERYMHTFGTSNPKHGGKWLTYHNRLKRKPK